MKKKEIEQTVIYEMEKTFVDRQRLIRIESKKNIQLIEKLNELKEEGLASMFKNQPEQESMDEVWQGSQYGDQQVEDEKIQEEQKLKQSRSKIGSCLGFNSRSLSKERRRLEKIKQEEEIKYEQEREKRKMELLRQEEEIRDEQEREKRKMELLRREEELMYEEEQEELQRLYEEIRKIKEKRIKIQMKQEDRRIVLKQKQETKDKEKELSSNEECLKKMKKLKMHKEDKNVLKQGSAKELQKRIKKRRQGHTKKVKVESESEVSESEELEEEKEAEREESESEKEVKEVKGVGCRKIKSKVRIGVQRKFGMSLNMAINTIPDFDGKAESLPNFIKILEEMVETYGTDSETLIKTNIPRKLKGKAASALAGKMRFKTVDAFIQNLKLLFGSIQNVESLKLKMIQTEQLDGESVNEYAEKMKEIEYDVYALLDGKTEIS